LWPPEAVDGQTPSPLCRRGKKKNAEITLSTQRRRKGGKNAEKRRGELLR